MENNLADKIRSELVAIASPEKGKLLQGFFKTGPGQYGEGDIFIGVTMPQIRMVAKKYYLQADLETVAKLVSNPVHEIRMCALIILVYKYPKASVANQQKIFDFYLAHTKYINNWDLVDVTCTRIVGAYLLNHDRKLLYQLAQSNSLWEKRIAVISTFMFIHYGEYQDSLALAEKLIYEKHDLMHKAVGWMLREVYKREPELICEFLNKYKSTMPRTTLRYAIEKMSKPQQKIFLQK
jgi:3-methyladenine DNA glycosylase AlkD